MADTAVDWSGVGYAVNSTVIDDGFTPEPQARDFKTTSQAATDDNFDGNFKPENISMHDAGDAGAEDRGCRICHADGHFARDCPDKPAFSGACFQCGEEGHSKAECPNPPRMKCKLCKEDHATSNCSLNRLFVAMNITAEATTGEAWDMLVAADKDRDAADIKNAILVYAKACSTSECLPATFVELEKTFRGQEMNTYLIAKLQEMSVTHTIANLKGEADQKFIVSIHFSDKPRRKRQDEGWPADSAENMERLAEAGFVVDSFVVLCHNCGEIGHTKARCEQEKQEQESIVVECTVCNEQGHRARDCTAPRRKPGGSKECRNCGQVGHMAKDCEQARPEPTCRNCDGVGHISRECSKPTDWSRVTCTNCGEKGHSYKRCKAPAADQDAGDDGGQGQGGSAADGGWDDNATGGW